ncbi:hypothetical protein QBC37DRAFT_296207 [Rhypophila decipiens]|uniref:FAD-binding domain-containing protein n=1 Tax=Rhypophila decipiens TaxID=261697 RepID=A0AAN6XXD1_9PEZI|nr:hypothetical protein QBC37DRAFT_296207 [Rhypophila decipiens]
MTAPLDSDSPIRIAIIGGGLAGAALANALVRLPKLEVHVYESAAEFSERGAAVGLSINAQKALERVFSASGTSATAATTAAKDILVRAGAVPMNSSRVLLGSGPQAGTMVADMGGSDPGVTVHRASLLRELLAPLPRGVLHAKRKLTVFHLSSPVGQQLQLTFQDSVTEAFDAVVGADGIFSTVRDFLLKDWDNLKNPGSQTPKKYAAGPAGFWDCRVLVPYDKAKAIIGPELFEEDRQYAWMGDGAFIMHDILENRTMVQCIISAVETDEDLEENWHAIFEKTEKITDRKTPLTREFLNKALETWLDGPIAKRIIDVSISSTSRQQSHPYSFVFSQPSPARYRQYEHKQTPSYTSLHSSRTLPIVLAGDAAHASTLFQGAGTGQAFEDAMILGTLFANLTSATQIPAAFRAYDALRRPRCQRVIDSSREMGYLCCGQGEGGTVGLDPDALRGAMAGKWDFIFGLDFEEYKKQAVGMMREELEKEGRKYLR